MKKTLLFWNGMATDQVSGGDTYINKLISNSDESFSIILSAQARRFIADKHEKILYTTDNHSTDTNTGIILLYLARAIRSFWFLLKTTTMFRRQDLVLASSPFICDIFPAMFCKSKDRAVILFHLIPKRSASTIGAKIRFILARIEQAMSLIIIRWRFNIVLVGNVELKAQLTKKFPNKKIVVADAGINTKEIDIIKTKKKDPDLAVFVGRLTTQKGVLDLVDIAKSVSERYPKFRLVVVGDGPHRHLLESKINELDVGNIELLGFISKSDKYTLMKRAKFFLFPSYEEGWGIALAEALYSGCHCFCYEIRHYRGLFGKYPEYIRMGDKISFAERIIKEYGKPVSKNQISFVHQYDDKLVIKNVLKAL